MQLNLMRQIPNPVRWVESIECIFRMGSFEFDQIGPGNVLTRLLPQIKAHRAFAS